METVTLKSGHLLKLEIAEFGDANKLKKIVARELLAVGVDFEKLNLNLELTQLDPKALNTFKNLACQLVQSDAVESAILACAKRCTLNGQRVTLELFEDPDLRGDYLPMQWEVMKLNLAVFFESLGLSSLTNPVTPKDGPA